MSFTKSLGNQRSKLHTKGFILFLGWDKNQVMMKLKMFLIV